MSPAAGSPASGFTVHTVGDDLVAARDAALDDAVATGVAAGLAAKDASLWGPDAADEAARRLGWLDLPIESSGLVDAIGAVRAELAAEGIDRVVLAGMGGSSLAPEVITRTAGVDLVVLDTTDAGQVRAAMVDLDRTVVVVSSKSGGTVETESHRRTFAAAFADSGLDAAAVGRRFVVVTDPGSPLEGIAHEMGARAVFLANPDVGGRYSALSAFGLVPAGLAGADIGALLASAAALLPTLGTPAGNAGLELGAALGGAGTRGRDKVVLVDDSAEIVGFGNWAEQLIAESTGKKGTGLLPVVVEGPGAPGTEPESDTHLVLIGGSSTLDPRAGDGSSSADHTAVTGALGAQFLGWEFAVAVAGRTLGIDPFDQPNVTESKENTTKILDAGQPAATPLRTDGPVEIYGDPAAVPGLDAATDTGSALAALLRAVPEAGYLAVMAYLDRIADAEVAAVRAALARATTRPVTFGWGPRFLHSTGQYHKGGPATGAYLQVTGAVADDLKIPGRSFSFATLQAAQWAGDLTALSDRNRPVLRLHLTDRADGVARLLEAMP